MNVTRFTMLSSLLGLTAPAFAGIDKTRDLTASTSTSSRANKCQRCRVIDRGTGTR